MTANKVLYWELLRLLMKLGIGHEHLDPKDWVACKRLPGKLREAPRNRREGLDRFRQGQSRVLVLNVLVSGGCAPGTGQNHCCEDSTWMGMPTSKWLRATCWLRLAVCSRTFLAVYRACSSVAADVVDVVRNHRTIVLIFP